MRVVYSVYGDGRSFEEFEISLKSLLSIHPEAAVDCYTDESGMARLETFPVNAKVIDGVIPVENGWHDPRFKVEAILRSATEPFIYLDNDTFVAGSLSSAWSLLTRFDVLAVLAPVSDQRDALKYPPLADALQVPPSFSEVNGGFFSSPAMIGSMLY